MCSAQAHMLFRNITRNFATRWSELLLHTIEGPNSSLGSEAGCP